MSEEELARRLILNVIKGWKRDRPNFYRAMKKAGLLEEHARDALNCAIEAQNRMLSQGRPAHEAWSESQRMYIALPDFDDEDEDGSKMMPLIVELYDEEDTPDDDDNQEAERKDKKPPPPEMLLF